MFIIFQIIWHHRWNPRDFYLLHFFHERSVVDRNAVGSDDVTFVKLQVYRNHHAKMSEDEPNHLQLKAWPRTFTTHSVEIFSNQNAKFKPTDLDLWPHDKTVYSRYHVWYHKGVTRLGKKSMFVLHLWPCDTSYCELYTKFGNYKYSSSITLTFDHTTRKSMWNIYSPT